MAETTIPDNALTSILDALDKANARVSAQFPGDSPARQPVHTGYGGAHLFKADAASKLGARGAALAAGACAGRGHVRRRARTRPGAGATASTCA